MRIHLIVPAVLLAASLAAHATVVNFDSQASGAPSGFNGVLNSPLTIGIATFTGGQLLNNEFGSVDLTGVYATTNLAPGAYTNPLHINFSQAVSGFSLLLTNNIADTFTVADNLGDTMTQLLAVNSMATFSLAGSGISSVSITEAGSTWDYAIDNVTFTANTSAVPEPSTLALLGTGLLTCVGVARRRLTRA